MKVKQIFNLYPHEHWDLFRDTLIRYCSYCGNPYEEEQVRALQLFHCRHCGQVHYINPPPAVSVIVEQKGRVLLGKRGKNSFQEGKWCLPCGFMEFNEDFLTAARREVKEETGLDVEILSILSVMTNYFTPRLHSLVVVMLAKPVGGFLEAGDDLEQVVWVDPFQHEKEMAFEADDHIIRRYFTTKLAGAPVEK